MEKTIQPYSPTRAQERAFFSFGPTETDIRKCRPYFLLPLLAGNKIREEDQTQALEHIQTFVNRLPDEDKPTDIYILSHGWHRNLFGAIAAYDRLTGRLAALMHRKRMPIPHPIDGKPYSPLFLALHWHSELGQDGWEDRAGRRRKTSFMTNARQAFLPLPGVSQADFANDFENIYELFAAISAMDTPALLQKTEADGRQAALEDPFQKAGRNLLIALSKKYLLRDSDPGKAIETADTHDAPASDKTATPGELAAVAWSCYYEAQPTGVLVDQSEPARDYIGPVEAALTLLKFAFSVGVGAFGLFAVLKLIPRVGPALIEHLSRLGTWALTLPVVHSLWNGLAANVWEPMQAHVFAPLANVPGPWQVSLGFVAALLTLMGTAAWQQQRRNGHAAQKTPLLAIAAWLPVQILLFLPLLSWTLLAYFLGGTGAWVCRLLRVRFPFVYDEHYRAGRNTHATWRDQRLSLAALARFPVHLLNRSVAKDSRVRNFTDTLESQLAFWEMQRKGVRAGLEAGRLLELLFQQPEFENARLHFIGHSFGALVVANAARYLASMQAQEQAPTAGQLRETLGHAQSGVTAPERQELAPPAGVATQTRRKALRLSSLTLVQGALASDWFVGEASLVQCLERGVACVYSAYDTANGFYYPFANSSRMAAGYVGLCRGPEDSQILSMGKGGLFAALVVPPRLEGWIPPCALVNLDASRIIHEGSPASGGGHDDIFKDDVIHLIWAATTLPLPCRP